MQIDKNSRNRIIIFGLLFFFSVFVHLMLYGNPFSKKELGSSTLQVSVIDKESGFSGVVTQALNLPLAVAKNVFYIKYSIPKSCTGNETIAQIQIQKGTKFSESLKANFSSFECTEKFRKIGAKGQKIENPEAWDFYCFSKSDRIEKFIYDSSNEPLTYSTSLGVNDATSLCAHDLQRPAIESNGFDIGVHTYVKPYLLPHLVYFLVIYLLAITSCAGILSIWDRKS